MGGIVVKKTRRRLCPSSRNQLFPLPSFPPNQLNRVGKPVTQARRTQGQQGGGPGTEKERDRKWHGPGEDVRRQASSKRRARREQQKHRTRNERPRPPNCPEFRRKVLTDLGRANAPTPGTGPLLGRARGRDGGAAGGDTSREGARQAICFYWLDLPKAHLFHLNVK